AGTSGAPASWRIGSLPAVAPIASCNMTDSSSRQSVTGLLLQWRGGRKEALDRLVPIVYSELKRLARTRLRGEQEGHSLQATALVHEVYLRLVDVDRMTLEAHFFAIASRLMRQVLVDHARR